jgi:hypothetical protein
MRAEEVDALLSRLKADEKGALGAMVLGDQLVWRPLPGPQSDAYYSAADVIGYGGAAGGGKTDLACGLALTRHTVSAIFRREATQLTAVIDRLIHLAGGREGYNGSQRIWRMPGRQIEFGSAPHPGDETRHQGRPKDLLVLDEASSFLESQARFLMGWVRTTRAGQKCTVLMTFNPPTTAEGRWVIDFFAPWLDDKHPNPAEPGELRWFATVDGRDAEVPDGRAFVLGGDSERAYDFDTTAVRPDQIVRPLSRTFIPSRVADNPYLSGTGYMATLQALPEPLRSQMLEGDFSAGLEDDRWQVIPTAWVDAAMKRWAPRTAKTEMESMGVDVARGGRDATIIARRHGTWFDELIVMPGAETPDGPAVAGQVVAHRRDRAVVHIDVVGWGASPYDFLTANGVQAVAVNGASKSSAKSREGALSFVNLRAEVWWRMREALDPNADAPIALPPDPALKADLCAPRWKQTASGIAIELKDDIAQRIGRSPDRGDAACLALMATPKQAAKPRRARPGGSWMG